MAKQLSKGTCQLCHAAYSKSGMSRHLETCLQRTYDRAQMEKHQVRRRTSAFHVLIEGRYQPIHWLHIEINAAETLATLDQFLRDIWLECCGHLSAFEIKGVRYVYVVDDTMVDFLGTRQRDMRVRLDKVLHPGQKYDYEYDFGSTTELTIKVLGEHKAPMSTRPLRLLARNHPFSVACDQCGQPATCWCVRCGYEGQGDLCDTCAKTHSCGQDWLRSPINSPRQGVCGYIGRVSR